MSIDPEMKACAHLMHLPSGKCLGCGEQHQPLADFRPGDDEKYLNEHLSEAPPTRSNTKIVELLREAYPFVVLAKLNAGSTSLRAEAEALQSKIDAALATHIEEEG